MIHQLTAVDPRAKIGKNVTVEPFTTIASDVVIGAGTWIGSNVTIMDGARIGKNCKIFPGTVISAIPQDLKFGGEKTRVVIGNFNTIREFVTIHRSTTADIGVTIMGDHNLIMAYCHVAHNCKLGNHVIMSNAATLAGHVHVEDYAIISGLTGVHQFCRVGAHCMIGGCSAAVKDIPPYTIAQGNHAKLYGLNLIGLKRRNFPEKTIKAISDAYRIVFRSKLLLENAIKKAESEVEDLPEVRHFIKFIKESERGICR